MQDTRPTLGLSGAVLTSFRRELVSIKEANVGATPPENSKPTNGAKSLGLLGAGTALGATAGLGAMALRGKGTRAQFMAGLRGLGRGGAKGVEMQSMQQGLPDAVVQHAKQIADTLRQKGIDPKTARIGIGATGGTGKSTLAEALKRELGMQSVGGDGFGRYVFGRDLATHFKKNPIAPGSIVEQTHLLNQLDPDQFDAIIHLEKPIKQIEEQLLKRGRGAAQADFYNNPRIQQGIRHAFDHTEGSAHDIAEGVRLKLRPEGGFQADRHLNRALAEKGVSVPESMDRQARLQSLVSGDAVSLPGQLPLLRKGHIAGIGAGGLVGGGMGYGATSYVMQNKASDG